MPSLPTRSVILFLPHLLVPLILLLLFPTPLVSAHGFLDWPNPRGALHHKLSTADIDSKAPFDPYLHFPAGSKAHWPGAGKHSQEVAAGYKWTPFEPLSPSFRWRAGVCGDTLKGRDHLRGGKFYFPSDDARPVATFRPGGVIDASVKIVAHHNGFVELHLCDISKCPGKDISQACFRSGHCIQLRRARNAMCDGGKSRQCGPIDRNYPGRWYLPCTAHHQDAKWERFGPGTMKFQIPSDFRCDMCVLHWFWSTANGCNPPGVIQYFDGPDGPKTWGNCPGQSGARGGVTRVQRPCGGKNFAEEYYQCADVVVKSPEKERYKASDGSVEQICTKDTCKSDVTVTPTPKRKKTGKKKGPRSTPVPKKVQPLQGRSKARLIKISASRDRHGGMSDIQGLFVVSGGQKLGALNNGDVIDGKTLPQLTFEADAVDKVSEVRFEISAGGKRWTSTERTKPFRMFAGKKEPFWSDVVYNERVDIKVACDGDTDVFSVKFVK